jgi:hypothetical protein
MYLCLHGGGCADDSLGVWMYGCLCVYVCIVCVCGFRGACSSLVGNLFNGFIDVAVVASIAYAESSFDHSLIDLRSLSLALTSGLTFPIPRHRAMPNPTQPIPQTPSPLH